MHEIYAWVAEDPDGQEGIVMVPDHNDNGMPLVSTERAVASVGKSYLVRHSVAERREAPIRLVRYVEAEVIDEVKPA